VNIRRAGFNLCAVVLSVLVSTSAPLAAAGCESLASLFLPNVTITLVQSVPVGGFSLLNTGPQAAQQNTAFPQLPAFCRVAATLNHRVTQISRLRSGCQLQNGTTNSWR
jgi:hypothetical protein